MPFTSKAVCSVCNATNSTIWTKGSEGSVLCIDCVDEKPDRKDQTEDREMTPVSTGGSSTSNTQTSSSQGGVRDSLSGLLLSGPVRKSARNKPSKYKYQATVKALPTKGKSRRVIFKKNPIKSPASVATVVTSNYVFHEEQYWQVGDIVSVMDHDGDIYYAQLRGFLQDQYCQKSAVITWLLPTLSSTPGSFDPATYIIGPEEDIPRAMSCFQFVMHAPSNYFFDKSSPYPTIPSGPELGFISTSLGSDIRRLPPPDQRYGLRDMDSDSNDGNRERLRQKQEPNRKRKREPKKRKPPLKIATTPVNTENNEAKPAPVSKVKVEGVKMPPGTAGIGRPVRRDRGRAKAKVMQQKS